MIIFSCDYCQFESKDSFDIKEVNIMQVGASLNGKTLPANEMMFKGGNHLCNACYNAFIAWSDGDLKNWIKDNLPLKKETVDNSG